MVLFSKKSKNLFIMIFADISKLNNAELMFPYALSFVYFCPFWISSMTLMVGYETPFYKSTQSKQYVRRGRDRPKLTWFDAVARYLVSLNF